MRDTSLIAYQEIQDKINTNEEVVLRIIKQSSRPLCDYEIARMLDWPINRVTGRRNKLEAKGLIEDVGKAKSPTGKAAHYWRAVKVETLF